MLCHYVYDYLSVNEVKEQAREHQDPWYSSRKEEENNSEESSESETSDERPNGDEPSESETSNQEDCEANGGTWSEDRQECYTE